MPAQKSSIADHRKRNWGSSEWSGHASFCRQHWCQRCSIWVNIIIGLHKAVWARSESSISKKPEAERVEAAVQIELREDCDDAETQKFSKSRESMSVEPTKWFCPWELRGHPTSLPSRRVLCLATSGGKRGRQQTHKLPSYPLWKRCSQFHVLHNAAKHR